MNIQGMGSVIVIKHKDGTCILNHNCIEAVFTTFDDIKYIVWASTKSELYKLNVFDTREEASLFAVDVYNRKICTIDNEFEVLGVRVVEED